MIQTNARRRIAVLCMGLGLVASATGAFAHTTVQAQATEGQSADNALRIGHGCESADGLVRGVIAQSVVFPTQAPELTTSDGSPIAALSEAIVQGSLAGRATPIQDRDIFLSQKVKRDGADNIIGFSGTSGVLSPDLRGRVPFQFAPPSFVTASCVKRLLIKVAIADICMRVHPRVTARNIGAGKVNLWIPANGSVYATLGAQAGVDGVGEAATLTVNRNLAANPLPPACGAGIDLTVTPSAADLNANLPIPGYWQ